MTVQALMDGVKAAVQDRWPGEEVYTNYLPEDFKRPAFVLEVQKDEWTDASLVLVRRTVTLLLTGYVETDAQGISDREVLNQRMEAVCGLFARGFLTVEDRALSVRTLRGAGATDFFETTLIVTWMDGRPAGTGPDDPPDEEPLMERYELNILTKE